MLRVLSLSGGGAGEVGLGVFDQFFDANRVSFVMAMADERIRAAGGFNQYLGPNQTSLDVDRGDFADADGHFIHAKPGAFAPGNRLVGDLNICGEKEIALGPTTRLEDF